VRPLPSECGQQAPDTRVPAPCDSFDGDRTFKGQDGAWIELLGWKPRAYL
jgi:hypothetical protein